MSEITGTIFDCKRFAVHDGNGIRSTLFIKGCPLRCPWCQNPEGLSPKPFLWHRPAACLHCGTCVAVCPNGALRLDSRVHIDYEKCLTCGTCAEACPGGALEICGREISASAAAKLLLRDQVFFGSEGGVTLSGGEVLAQWRFAAEVLRLCKEAGANTAIESCLLAGREAIDALIPVTDLFIIDIKILDCETHERICGAPNTQILKNYEYLIARGCDVLVRTPVIPGYTDSRGNLDAIAAYIERISPGQAYELLDFNPLCRSKYDALETDYPVEEKK